MGTNPINIYDYKDTYDPDFWKYLMENYPDQEIFTWEEMQRADRGWKGITDPEILPNGMLYKEGRMGQYAPPPTTSQFGSFTPDIRPSKIGFGGASSSGPQAFQQLARQRMFKATGQPQHLGNYQPKTGLNPAIAPMQRPNMNLLPKRPFNTRQR